MDTKKKKVVVTETKDDFDFVSIDGQNYGKKAKGETEKEYKRKGYYISHTYGVGMGAFDGAALTLVGAKFPKWVFGVIARFWPGRTAAKVAGKFKFPGYNPAKAPKGFEWKGKPGSAPGSKDGNWFNPKTRESLRPDLNHPDPIGPHWDYKDPSGKWWRIFEDGSNVPK